MFQREGDFKLYLRLLREYKEVFDFILCAFGDYFRRDPASFCQGIAKVKKRVREEDRFREKLTELKKDLVEGRKRKIKK